MKHYILTLTDRQLGVLAPAVASHRYALEGLDRTPDPELASLEAQLREPISLELRPPSVLPPMSDEDYGAWRDTVDVLGYTSKGDAFVAYAQVWDPNDAPSADDLVRWKLKGRDSYDFDDMAGWLPLPKMPSSPPAVPTEEGSGG